MKNPTCPDRYVRMTQCLHTDPTLDTTSLEAAVKAGHIDAELAARLARDVDDARRWIEADAQRTQQFRHAPLTVLSQWNDCVLTGELASLVPLMRGDLAAGPCAKAPDPSAYDACVKELLQKAFVWTGMSAAHVETFTRQPEAAIDAVSAGAPAAAAVLAKDRLLRARRLA